MAAPGSEAYRDELGAAQERIARLERLLAERTTGDALSSRVAALLRERAHVEGRITPWSVWPKMWWLFLVFVSVGVVFAMEGDWAMGLASLAAPFAMGFVGQRVVDGNAATAARQLALADGELAAIDAGIESHGQGAQPPTP
ncbi:MAG TPA: hypothetical protein VIF09_18560 [Polyangiaceae bacterium]